MKSFKMATLFFISFVWMTSFFGLASYAFVKAQTENSDFVPQLAEKYGFKFAKNNYGFYFSKDSEQKSIQSDENYDFSPKVTDLILNVTAAQVELVTSKKDKIHVSVAGSARDKSTQNPLLVTEVTDQKIRLSESEEQRIQNLKIIIEIPESFGGAVRIESVSGIVQLNGLKLSNLEIETVAAKVEALNIDSRHVSVKTISGNINLESQNFTDMELESISGDINLKVPANQAVFFETSSTSGKIHNSHAATEDAENKVRIETTSGNINIENL